MFFSPWKSLTPWTHYEVGKTLLATVTLIAPVRFVTVCALLLLGSLFTLPLSNQGCSRLLGIRYRQVVRVLIRLGCRLILFVCGFMWVFTNGQYDGRATILLGTHHSVWDSLWLIWYCGASQTAKVELFKTTLISGYLTALDSLSIDRWSRKGRAEALEAIRRRAHCANTYPLLIFPGAVCSNCRELIEFKRGAFEPGVPIQPVGIAYPARHFDLTHSRWPLWDMYRTMCQLVNFMTVTFLPIQFPDDEDKAHPAEWMRRVRETMGRSLDMQLVPYNYEAEYIRTRCRDLGLIFNDTKCRITNIGFVMTIVKAFVEIDYDRDGWISRSDASRSGANFERAFLDSFGTIKLPNESEDSSAPNSESWIETGIVGWMTGGRPLLPSRPLDPYRDDAIEVAELITYFNTCIENDVRPCPELVTAFNMSQYMV